MSCPGRHSFAKAASPKHPLVLWSVDASIHSNEDADQKRQLQVGTDMRLADFILSDMEAILQRWDEFAATLHPAAASMNRLVILSTFH